jgi:hypothetical protein
MFRIAALVIAGVVGLYVVWNFLQFLLGSYHDRRTLNKKGDDAT